MMAVSLNFENCARRFLSPTRCCQSQDREISTAVSRKKLRRQFFSPCRQHQRRSNRQANLPSKLNSVLSSTKNIVHSVQEWTGKTVIDMSTLSGTKIINRLNIEVPKVWSLTNFSSDVKQSSEAYNEVNVEKKSVKTISVEKDQYDCGSSKSEVSKRTDKETKVVDKNAPKALLSKIVGGTSVDESVQREQHDFQEAMSHNYESVSSFYKPSNVSQENIKTIAVEQNVINPVKIDKNKIPSQSRIGQSIITKLGTNLAFLPNKKEPSTKVKKIVHEKQKTISKASVDRHTRQLAVSVKCATELTSKLIRLENLCSYLIEHPEGRNVVYQERIIPVLLTWKKSKDVTLKEQTQEALALLGYIEPVRGHGIRVLSLDGGGTRGMVSLKILQEIEKTCNTKLHDMFDYVCGVSTGSLLATLIFACKIPLDKIEDIYREFSQVVFNRNRAAGAMSLVTAHSYYNSDIWEEVLKKNIGDSSLSSTARDITCPKLSTVSAVVNAQKIHNYIFRNYNYPQGVGSTYRGSINYKLWEAVKASSAAPGYFEECKLRDLVFQDGGILTNNPTAIAVHECKLLWPNTPLQCVISVGTGRYETDLDSPLHAEYSRITGKVDKIVQSATDTEAVHITVEDLLPASTYFRLNPFLCEDITLNEIRGTMWQKMILDTDLYCQRNRPKFKALAERLLKQKTGYQKTRDLTKEKFDKLDLAASFPQFLNNTKSS